jgi:integrase
MTFGEGVAMASVNKDARSPYWLARYRDGNGKGFCRSTKQKQKAKALEVAFSMERIARGEVPTMGALIKAGRELIERLGQTLDAPTIAEELKTYLEALDGSKKSASTKTEYRAIAREFMDHLGKAQDKKLTSLTASDIERFKAGQNAKGLSPKRVTLKLKLIRSILKRATDAGRIEKNPALLVSYEEGEGAGREDFTPTQIKALLRASKGFKKDKGRDWHGLVCICYYTGARLSDAANLRAGDVHLNDDEPFLQFMEKKRKKLVKRSLHPDLQAYFIGREAGDDPKAFLFPTLAGRGTGGANGLSREFIGLMSAAGIERRLLREGSKGGGRAVYNLSEHSLRHATVSQLLEAGVDEGLRMSVVGHDDKGVHRNYSHARTAAHAAVAKLPSVLPAQGKGKK